MPNLAHWSVHALVLAAGAILQAQSFEHPFLWSEDQLIDLGTLGGHDARATDLNDLGHVVGASRTTDGSIHGFLYRGAEVVDLGSLPGHTFSSALAINNQDDIVGEAGGIDGLRTPVRWRNLQIQDLGIPPGLAMAVAIDVNAFSQILVSASGLRRRALFIWEEGAWTQVAPLSGHNFLSTKEGTLNDLREVVGVSCRLDPDGGLRDCQGFLWSGGVSEALLVSGDLLGFTPFGLNNRSQIVGRADVIGAPPKPYLWERAAMTELGILGSAASTHIALDINDSGVITGLSGGQAVLWENATPRSLGNLPCFVGAQGTAINESGQIVGFAFCEDCLPAVEYFRRGDANGDEQHDISDAITILLFLFVDASISGCDDALDANDDGQVDISDATGMLPFLFLGGLPPAMPFMDCGEDPTEDALQCRHYAPCAEPCR